VQPDLSVSTVFQPILVNVYICVCVCVIDIHRWRWPRSDGDAG